MEVVLATQRDAGGQGTGTAVADGVVEGDGVGPIVGVVVAQPAPSCIAAERAADTSGLDDGAESVFCQVCLAVVAGVAEVEEGEDVVEVADVGVFGAVALIGADPDGLVGEDSVGDAAGVG